jgi:perosamine synthetase
LRQLASEPTIVLVTHRGGERIPVYRPVVSEDDVRAVTAAAGDGWVSGTSPRIAELERRLSRYCGAGHGAATSSGTSALEIALAALRIGPGDEVICPSLTIISCARAILAVGATPVFVDVDPKTWCLDVEAALARVGPRTRAVLAVHLFGWPVDLERLAPLREQGIFVIEDAAQAMGSELRVDGEWKRCGGAADLSTFSFYANKTITTGEGGMVVGSDERLIARARRASSLFFGEVERYRHEELGLGARMNGLGAALGLSQLSRIDEITRRKKEIAATYREALSELDVRMAETPDWARPVPWMAAVVVPRDARAVMEELDAHGIETRPFFVGMHRQPVLKTRGIETRGDFPETDALSRHGLYLPSSLDLDSSDIARVADALRDALRKTARSPFCFGAEYARRYDAIYEDKPYTREAEAIRDVLERESDAPPKRLLDLGCGTGRHAQALAELGFEVTGVDRSPAMIAEAKARRGDASRLSLLVQEIEELDLGGEPHDAALLLFTVLGYLGDDESVVRALERVRRHLRPGALLIADVWDRAAVLAEPPTNGEKEFETDEGTFLRCVEAEHLPDDSRVRVRYRIRDATGRTRADELHDVRYFDEASLRALLRRARLELESFAPWPELRPSEDRRDYTAHLVARAV